MPEKFASSEQVREESIIHVPNPIASIVSQGYEEFYRQILPTGTDIRPVCPTPVPSSSQDGHRQSSIVDDGSHIHQTFESPTPANNSQMASPFEMQHADTRNSPRYVGISFLEFRIISLII